MECSRSWWSSDVVRLVFAWRSAHMRQDVLQLVLRQGLTPAVTGVVVGIGISMAGSRVVRSLLFEVSPSDPLSLTAVSALLLVLAMIASLVPAWRAMRVDPVAALNGD